MLLVRLGSEIYYQPQLTNGLSGNGILFQIASINFAHMAIFMFLISVLLCITTTLTTNPPDYKKIKNLSLGTLSIKEKEESMNSYSKIDILFSIILVFIVVGILGYFTQ